MRWTTSVHHMHIIVLSQQKSSAQIIIKQESRPLQMNKVTSTPARPLTAPVLTCADRSGDRQVCVNVPRHCQAKSVNFLFYLNK